MLFKISYIVYKIKVLVKDDVKKRAKQLEEDRQNQTSVELTLIQISLNFNVVPSGREHEVKQPTNRQNLVQLSRK